MSNNLSRGERTAKLTDGVIDVLVVGGGIVGAGVARDAAGRGLSTAVIDRRDFAFGTSSRSSRLLHGGLRYLAQGRLRLVRESSVEKMVLHRIAPHLAQPLPLIFPTYAGTEWKRWKLAIGVKLYDLLCGRSNLGTSSSMSPESVLARLPELRSQGLTGAVRYFDGFTNDARLVLDTLRSAEAKGATTLNYAGLISAELQDATWRCGILDEQSGREIRVRSRCVVNAAGAWSPGVGPSRVKLRITKGIHVLVDRSRLPVPEAVVMTDGPRILFVLPWGRRMILGTTDTDYNGPLDSPSSDPADVRYVLEITNRTFPAAGLGDGDIISGWSGLRPLIADPHGRPSDISRAHQILPDPAGWIDVAGGKLTTYRHMAEQTVDKLVKMLGRPTSRCMTAIEPLLAPQDDPSFSGITPPAPTAAAVKHFCRNEWAEHLDDVMVRRTGWTYYDRDNHDLPERVAGWMGAAMGWPAARTKGELERYQNMTRGNAIDWAPLPDVSRHE